MATTSVHSGWPTPTRKRDRDDEYEDIALGGTLGFTEHRSKRLHSLPLRTSPSSKRPAGPPAFPPPAFTPPQPTATAFGKPQAITPTDSDSEESNHVLFQQHGAHFAQAWAGPATNPGAQRPASFGTHSGLADPDADMMDASDGAPETAPAHVYSQTAHHLEPGSLQPDAISPSITGRMPTPIHCSFAAQVRGNGNNWSGAAGNISHAAGPMHQDRGGSLTTSRDSYQGSGMLGHQAVPRSFDGPGATAAVMADWTLVQNRRLPSPISENGAEDGFESVEGSPGMILDSSAERVNSHGHRHPLLSSLPPRATSAMEMGTSPTGGGAPRVATPTVCLGGAARGEGERASADGSAMDVEPPATPSPRKGHTRSRHTLNSWTIQPGMKKSFSIGYRADCEKCRMKVPGHFNHIIVS